MQKRNRLSVLNNLEVLFLPGILAIFLLFGGYQLRALPGDWYGDISIEHREVVTILNGEWPWRFALSAGPAYHYVVAAFARVLGPNFTAYKLASLFTGLVAVLLTYLLAKELAGRRAALLSALAAATSFWLIVFARLGSSPQILTPVLSAGAVYFLLRFARTRRLRNAAISMVFAGMGIFTYPSTFVLPLVVLALIGWNVLFPSFGPPPEAAADENPVGRDRVQVQSHALRRAGILARRFQYRRKPGGQGCPPYLKVSFGRTLQKLLLASSPRLAWFRAGLLAAVILLVFSGWFYTTAKSNPAFSQGGYVGGKLFKPGGSPLDELRTFGKNMVTALGMFQFTGDQAFRTNASGQPVLDPLSAILMDLGLAALLLDRRLRCYWPYLVAPILILLVPSADPGLPAVEIPSASRTLGAAPFVFVLVGLGFQAAYAGARALLAAPERVGERLRGAYAPSWRGVPVTGAAAAAPNVRPAATGAAGLIAGVVLALLLAVTGYLNVNKYFTDYAWGLPEHNQAWAWQIARTIDAQPATVTVKMGACCWGIYKDPDPESIYYQLHNRENRRDLLASPYIQGCADLQPGKPYLIIFPPAGQHPLLDNLRGCFPNAQGQLHTDGLGTPAFYTLIVNAP